jgi:nicotinic acid mononucleotide adenylyltransferase
MATPPDKKKLKGFKEFDPSKYIDTEPTIEEAVMKNTVVVSFGRMNPITVGHEKLIDKVTSEAGRLKADPMVFMSHSQDAKKNPLSYDDKVKFAKKAFGNTIQKSNAKTIIDVAKSLSGKYKNFVMVVGSDRVDEFQNLLSKYNGKEFNFETIKMVSAGERDPDAEGVEGMSASKMRSLAADKNIKDFSKGLPKKLQSSASSIMTAVRKGMNMTEETTNEDVNEAAVLTRQQRRKRSIAMRKNRFKIRRGKEKSERKTASREILMKRAKKAAINIFKKKFAKNRPYEELSAGEKEVVDKRIAKISPNRLNTIARKLMPVVKQRERDRRAAKTAAASGAPKNESIDEASYKDTRTLKRPHQLMDSNNKPKFDARFRMFKKKNVNESVENLAEELINLVEATENFVESLDEKTIPATKKAVNTVGPDGKTRTVWKRTSDVRTDDHGQDKLSTNEEFDSAPFKDLKSAVKHASDKVKTHRDHEDGIEVYKHKGGYHVNHTMNSSGRNSLKDSGAKHLGTVYRDKKFNVTHNVKESVESIFEAKLPHALNPNKSLKHAYADRMVDKDNDGDTDKFDKQDIPDEITSTEKIDQTSKMLKKNAGELKHTRKGMSYEEAELDEISMNALNNYTAAANKDYDKAHAAGDYKKSFKRASGLMKASGKKIEKDTAGIRKALNKEQVEEAVDKSSDVYKHYTELKKKSVKELRDTIKGSHKIVDTSGFDKHGAISHILRGKHGNKKVAAAMGLDEANFADTMKKAVAAHERGDHKKAAYHLDNAKTARYAMKSTEISKHKDLLDKYKELRDMHEATFKVDIEGLPSMYIDAGSASQVKKTFRQMLKKPDDMIKGVDRVQPAEVKKHFRLKALGKDEEQIDEATYKVDIEGLPSVFIDAGSEPQVKKSLRLMLKKPDDRIKSVDRVQPHEVAKHFRLKALGKEDSSEPVEEASTPYYNKASFLKRMSSAAKQERLAREKKEKESKPVKEEAGAGEEGTDKLVKKYKKDTPGCK